MRVIKRLPVLVPIGAVLVAAVSLALLAAILAGTTAWGAFEDVVAGNSSTVEVKTEFLGIASLVLQAAVFYLVGIGLYALFVGPIAIPAAFVPKSLKDLEVKVVNLVVVILATEFMERYTEDTDGTSDLAMAGALALAIPALVLFQWYLGREE